MTSYIESNKDRFVSELLEFLKIPSVSTESSSKEAMYQAANFVKERLLQAGADMAEIKETKGWPMVYGEKMVDASLPTVLVYGHYDVQPVDPLNLWKTPPFEPDIRDGYIYARGASDDKGQMYVHVKALEVLNNSGDVPCNIKFLFEGEEEIGSDNLEPFVEENKDMLAADVVLISDTSIIDNDTPSITTGLRGLCYLEVELTGPDRDLHSGLYGGAVVNPINALVAVLTKLKDENHRITIPGFYDSVAEVSEEERKEMAKIPFDGQAFIEEVGVTVQSGEKGFSVLERVGIRPSLDINGIWGGYTGEGAKTVIPSKAYAKVSMRLVPNQSSDEITQLVSKHIESLAPEGTTIKVTAHHGAEPAVTPIDSVAYQAASKAFMDTFGKNPVPVRGGGSIPIVPMFKKVLGIDTIMMGFGLDSDAIHSPNERFGLFNYIKGIETVPLFYKYLAEESKK